VNGKTVGDDDKFSLVTTDFIATGGDGNNTFIGLDYTVCGDSLQAFIDYFETMENITESTIQMDRQIPVCCARTRIPPRNWAHKNVL
jgi:hypothetical protein